MRVREERLAAVRAGRWSEAALLEGNPVVLEAVDELFQSPPDAAAARHVAGLFATAIGLDQPGAPRISVTVASRVTHEVAAASRDELQQRLHDLAADPIVRMVCAALIGSDGDRTATDSSQQLCERALCLVAQLVVTQEEVDALRGLVEPD